MFPPTDSHMNTPAEQLASPKRMLGKLGLNFSFVAHKYLHKQALQAPGEG